MTLWKLYDDGDGHTYLVSPEGYKTLMDWTLLGEWDMINDYLESCELLEGGNYYVVLGKDVDGV